MYFKRTVQITDLVCSVVTRGLNIKHSLKQNFQTLKDSSNEGKSLILNSLDALEITLGCVYDIDHMYKLRIENTSETDPRSYKTTKAVAKKAQKEFLGFKGIRSHDLRNTGVVIYQLSYEVLLVVD